MSGCPVSLRPMSMMLYRRSRYVRGPSSGILVASRPINDRSVGTSRIKLRMLNPWDYADILVSCDNLSVSPRTRSGGVRGFSIPCDHSTEASDTVFIRNRRNQEFRDQGPCGDENSSTLLFDHARDRTPAACNGSFRSYRYHSLPTRNVYAGIY